MITIARCGACGTAWHPPRVLCPACSAADWRDEACATATVEECTALTGGAPVVLTSVRTTAGPAVIAALPAAAAPGTVVRLRPGPENAILGEPA